MSIRTLALFGVLAIALGAGVITAAWGTTVRMAGWVALGIIPLTWAVLSIAERLGGREIWHLPAPYPYRWMTDEQADDRPLPPALTDTVHGKRPAPVESRAA